MIAELTEPETQTGFRALRLIQPLLDSLERAGYTQPSPIQDALIPIVMTGRDALGQAQTGTGKTAAFLLPFMNSCAAVIRPSHRRSYWRRPENWQFKSPRKRKNWPQAATSKRWPSTVVNGSDRS